jgi:hypothetical protein
MAPAQRQKRTDGSPCYVLRCHKRLHIFTALFRRANRRGDFFRWIAGLRPFYFMTVFWGEEFRTLFLDFCLASLLSPNNIPALENRSSGLFIVCTTAEDRAIVEASPIFARLLQHMPAQFVEIVPPKRHDDRYIVMSSGHKKATEIAFRALAYGIFVSPDAMLSDGSIACLQNHARAGARVVLASALRFKTEPTTAALRAAGLVAAGEPLTISSRELLAIALQHPHPENARLNFESPTFSRFPVGVWWRAPDGNGIVLFTFSWGPMLFDYGSLANHDSETFDRWTLDGDYVVRNFPNPADIRVIADSDELTYISFTRSDDRVEHLVRNRYKEASIRSVFHAPIMDAHKHRLFLEPVRIHSGPVGPQWEPFERQLIARLQAIVARKPYKIDQIRSRYLEGGLRSLVFHGRVWISLRLRRLGFAGLAGLVRGE